MLQFIFAIIIWIIVPGIMLAILVLSFFIVTRVGEAEPKVSARAGVAAGLLLFVVYVVYQLMTTNSTTNLQSFPHFGSFSFFHWAFLAIATIVGFCLLWGVAAFLPTRLVGMLTLFLSAASSIALFSYFFSEDLRATAMFFALGTVIGMVLHIIILPKSVRVLMYAPPYLWVTPTVLYGRVNSQYISMPSPYWSSSILLQNKQNARSDLNWTVMNVGRSGVGFNPPNGTLAPGQFVDVEVYIPDDRSRKNVSLFFKGPLNTVEVLWMQDTP